MAGLDSDSGSLAPEPILSHLAIPPPPYGEHDAEWKGGNQETLVLQRVAKNERVHVHGEGHSRQSSSGMKPVYLGQLLVIRYSWGEGRGAPDEEKLWQDQSMEGFLFAKRLSIFSIFLPLGLPVVPLSIPC